MQHITSCVGVHLLSRGYALSKSNVLFLRQSQMYLVMLIYNVSRASRQAVRNSTILIVFFLIEGA